MKFAVRFELLRCEGSASSAGWSRHKEQCRPTLVRRGPTFYELTGILAVPSKHLFQTEARSCLMP